MDVRKNREDAVELRYFFPQPITISYLIEYH